MTTGQFLWEVFLSLIWPPKGIIYFETQVLMWIYAYSKVWLTHNMPIIIMAAAIIFVIGCAVFGHTRPHMPRGIFGRVFGTIFRVLTNIIFAWGLLIYGAAVGQVDNANGEANARISYTRRIHTGPIWNVVHSFTRLSLHFYLGRGIFRLFFYLLGFIPRLRENSRNRGIIARVLTFVVIFWGVWMIPYDLTH